MRYAMILNNRVIDMLDNQNTVPHYPPDKHGNKVTPVECDETVYRGMEYDFDTNTFMAYNPVPTSAETPQPTQLDLIQKSVEKLYADIQSEAVNAVILDLTERGVL